MAYTQKTNAQGNVNHPECLFGKMMQERGFTHIPGNPSPSPPGWLPSQDDDSTYYVIPTVVHVIYDSINNFTTTDVSDDAVKSEIKVLNEDYGKQYNTPGYNDYPFGVDTRIRYCLATIDPNGNPTTGIDHIYSKDFASINSNIDTVSGYYLEMNTKNLSRWDQKRYLNVWVVAAVDGQSNVAGYSYLANESAGQEFDGIVVVYLYFGDHQHYQSYPYNMGRTSTHECGHYFNLYHPWGPDYTGQNGCTDGGDSIYDTPPCAHPYYSQPVAYSHDDSCQTPFECNTDYRLVEDYMDYSFDTCMDVFTRGQTERMRSAIRTYRSNLVNYTNIVTTGCRNYYLSLNPANQDQLTVNGSITANTLNIYPLFINPENAQITLTDMRGRIIVNIAYPSMQNATVSLPVPQLSNGMYIITVTTNSAKYTDKVVVTGRY